MNRYLARCLVGIVLAMLIGLTAGSGTSASFVAGGNSIQITIDTSKKGQITAFGSFTTAPNVTLTKVTV